METTVELQRLCPIGTRKMKGPIKFAQRERKSPKYSNDKFNIPCCLWDKHDQAIVAQRDLTTCQACGTHCFSNSVHLTDVGAAQVAGCQTVWYWPRFGTGHGLVLAILKHNLGLNRTWLIILPKKKEKMLHYD